MFYLTESINAMFILKVNPYIFATISTPFTNDINRSIIDLWINPLECFFGTRARCKAALHRNPGPGYNTVYSCDRPMGSL